MANSASWQRIFDYYSLNEWDFENEPYYITSKQIKIACHDFTKTSEKEVRILCKQDSRKDRPQIFIDKGLFILPVKNGKYVIVKGEGYVDIPDIDIEIATYDSRLDFKLDSSIVGNSEMQHLDFAYASSLIRTFMDDDSLVLTIRGRKYTPQFDFQVGNYLLHTEKVQTEVDAGYEGKDKIVLVEAKNTKTKNTIIRQLYYPFRQWQKHTDKDVVLLFFEKRRGFYLIWQYEFSDVNDYNSIVLKKFAKYRINSPNTKVDKH
ncbi:Mu-like prophage protein gp29 [Mucinivorans hirudinis]|uniref:Mu-like prophage protein gp29 n=1 Tax=Mucinivorans hirudinis TaxID=1433126 RepID=A0A060RA46_9BACT|nr:Mu-like prophage protein gp29 [Mucinivorans hirudinis]